MKPDDVEQWAWDAALKIIPKQFVAVWQERLRIDIARTLMAERERAAKIAEGYKRDASFDDSMVGAVEHNANQANIAAAIRQEQGK